MKVSDCFSIEGRNIVITGATSGIGRAIALACAAAGARVAAIGRNSSRLKQLEAELATAGSDEHRVYEFDVTNYDAIPGVIAEIVRDCGKINGFVHCAGSAMIVPLKMMNHELYERLFAVNVFAGYEFAKHIVSKKNFDQSLRGSLVFISSVSAMGGEPGLIGYASTKGAILAGTKTLAAELASRNIKVNALVPGHIENTMMGQQTFFDLPNMDGQKLRNAYPLGQGKTNDLIGPTLFLLSSASDWMTGTHLLIDGGYCL